MEICPYANLLLVGSSSDKKLSIWNYDSLKLAYVVNFNSAITSFIICADKGMLTVSTLDGMLFTFGYKRKDLKLKLQLLSQININDIYDETS